MRTLQITSSKLSLRGSIMARRPGRFVRSPGPRRAMTWGSTDLPVTAVPAGTVVLLASFTAAQLVDLSPSTIVRERGNFSIFSDQAASNETQEGVLGFAIVTDQARAAGVASMPAPVADADWDGWYGWFPFNTQLRFGSGVGFEHPFGLSIDYDTKAMRKVGRDEAAVIIIENASSGDGFNTALKGRTLFKLH